MKKALFGYGGHAKEVALQMGVHIKFFVDDEFSDKNAMPISKFNPKKYKLLIAVSDPKERENIVKRLPQNTKFFTFIHPTALILNDNVEIDEGSFIGAYSIITTNVKLGKHSILNRSNHVGHDCKIGNYFSAMPGAIVSGNVELGDRVYMGSNSTIKEKIKITSDVTIGMNGCVSKNITETGTYVGVPVKKLYK